MNSQKYEIQNLGKSVYLVQQNMKFFEILFNVEDNKVFIRSGILCKDGSEDRFWTQNSKVLQENASKAIRFIEREVEKKFQEGYQERKLEGTDSKIHQQENHPFSTNQNPQSSEDPFSQDESFSQNDHHLEEEEDEVSSVSENCSSDQQPSYGRRLILDAFEEIEQDVPLKPKIISKKIQKPKVRVFQYQGLARSQENSEKAQEIQMHKRNCRILLRPSPLETLEQIDFKNYYMTERFEGISCYWDGKTLYTSSFNKCEPYKDFLKDFPQQQLIGELVMINGSTIYQQVRSLTQTPSEKWLDLVFVVQDLRDEKLPFNKRLDVLKTIKTSAHITIAPYKIYEQTTDLNAFIEKAKSRQVKDIYLKYSQGEFKGGNSGGFYIYPLSQSS